MTTQLGDICAILFTTPSGLDLGGGLGLVGLASTGPGTSRSCSRLSLRSKLRLQLRLSLR